MMIVVLTMLDKLDKGHNTAPRVKKAWVRKVDIIHPLRGRGGGVVVDSPRVWWSHGIPRIIVVLILPHILEHVGFHVLHLSISALYFMLCIQS
jgi:hypothetical protein